MQSIYYKYIFWLKVDKMYFIQNIFTNCSHLRVWRRGIWIWGHLRLDLHSRWVNRCCALLRVNSLLWI